jgi:hypothetical protein
MTLAQTTQMDPDRHARSIDRWDDEGGSLSRGTNPEATLSRYGDPRPLVAEPATPVDRTYADEEKILERLGAAVTTKWGTLPTKIQKALFEHATSLPKYIDSARFKGRLARFLHDNRDRQAAQPGEGMKR